MRVGLSDDMNCLYRLMRHLEECLLYNAKDSDELSIGARQLCLASSEQ